ncbi:MAG: acetyl-CoA carboxylase biotin carboxyl carrier protein subunit [Planctomycetota bacterium]|nr:acetyl-CoA carboxylase biotin carboxyl carrier protein subunit [Planctomycetota bacterium]
MATRYTVRIDGEERDVEVDGDVARVDGVEVRLLDGGDGRAAATVRIAGRRRSIVAQPDRRPGVLTVLLDGRILEAEVLSARDRLRAMGRSAAETRGPMNLLSEIPGIVRRIFRRPGDAVEAGETILTLEAMKMENEIRAGASGRIASIHVSPGQKVSAGEVLAVVEPESQTSGR